MLTVDSTSTDMPERWSCLVLLSCKNSIVRVWKKFPGAAVTPLQVTDFKHGSVWPIMIVSYETLRKFADGLAGFCDVLVCDEGHR